MGVIVDCILDPVGPAMANPPRVPPALVGQQKKTQIIYALLIDWNLCMNAGLPIALGYIILLVAIYHRTSDL